MQSNAQQNLATRGPDAGETAALAHPALRVEIAHGIEALMQAFAVRASVFIGEWACPYAEEFDGNDFTATHLLGYVGSEPASTCRLRYFADFVRLERFAVRREFRKGDVAVKMIEYALEFCRKKGFRKIHGQANGPMIRYHRRFGFQRISDKTFMVAGQEYVELLSTLEPHPDPIAIGEDPLVLARSEGAWDQPGAFETSAAPAEPLSTSEASDSDWALQLRRRSARLG